MPTGAISGLVKLHLRQEWSATLRHAVLAQIPIQEGSQLLAVLDPVKGWERHSADARLHDSVLAAVQATSLLYALCRRR